MILAAYRDTPYNIVLFLHILCVLAAFAPAFINPILDRRMDDIDQGAASTVRSFQAIGTQRIHGPALALAGILGFGLVGMSGDPAGGDTSVYSMSDGWIVAAMVVWVAMNGVLHGLLYPAERAYGTGNRMAKSKVDLGGVILTVLLLILLYLMVFRPGA
ncbi:MAG: hypothetical protein GY745_14155 [Actinomycetia bacterium]|nr:hypothetical protein [Actinomycetes bacterium]MCP3909629.1 hypothetical protein [Actinomycetes bacterium]MCP4086179.1 hypothetical protein [Actinomycetes bacterium]